MYGTKSSDRERNLLRNGDGLYCLIDTMASMSIVTAVTEKATIYGQLTIRTHCAKLPHKWAFGIRVHQQDTYRMINFGFQRELLADFLPCSSSRSFCFPIPSACFCSRDFCFVLPPASKASNGISPSPISVSPGLPPVGIAPLATGTESFCFQSFLR